MVIPTAQSFWAVIQVDNCSEFVNSIFPLQSEANDYCTLLNKIHNGMEFNFKVLRIQSVNV